ncbi:MAG: hypothetical protein KF812_12065 [Fimbriimonadaceae bacterium]|nr:hypothetical protein [Fimbriimonadaceae bacterium]
MPEGRRVFSEEQAAEILQRAARLQEAENSGTPYTPGITEAELARIATEAGIDSAFLNQALAGMSEPEQKERLLKFVNEAVRVVEGELDPEDFDLIVDGLPTTSHNKMGRNLTQIGRQVSGTVWVKQSNANLEVKSRNGRTRISVKTNPFFPLFGTLYPAFIGSVMAIAIASENNVPWVGAAIAAGLIAAASIGAPLWLKATHRAGEALADDLAEKAKNAIGPLEENLNRATPVMSEETATHQDERV